MGAEPLILAVDDEAGILRLLKLDLGDQGFRVVTSNSGEEAIKAAEEHRPDIVLLDLRMPDLTGLEVMGLLRERVDVPVIVVSGANGEADKVRALEHGADDYIVKPFSSEELAARVRAVLRRSLPHGGADMKVRSGDTEIDLHRRIVTKNGKEVSLTRTEWLLLQTLAANAGRVMLTAELLTRVWGPEYRDDLQYARVWISRLRHKIEVNPSEPRIVKTYQGIGYMFVADPSGEPGATASRPPNAAITA